MEKHEPINQTQYDKDAEGGTDRPIEEIVEEKLEEARKRALPEHEVEDTLSQFLEIQRKYHSDEIDNNTRYDLSQPLMESLLKSAARFSTITEYSLAFRKLQKAGWLSQEQAYEILDHENAHALPVLQHPSGEVEYLLIFMRNKNNEVDSFQPVAYTKFRTSSEEENKKISHKSVSAPEKLSPGDLAVLKDVK